MVKGSNALSKRTERVLLPKGDLKWSSVHLSEVFARTLRLEASVFDVEGKHAREVLQQCRYEIVPLVGEGGIASAYHRPRFRRIFVEKSDLPIYQPSQITEIYPKPHLYISGKTDTDINSLRVRQNQILLTCSGTIGNCTLVSKTLENRIFSHDALRISANNAQDTGYVYAFLRNKIGQVLLRTNNYGAVVQHIEPDHLEYVPIPNPPTHLKYVIHKNIIDSFALRDDSNDLMDEASRLLKEELRLPALESLTPANFKKLNLRAFDVKLSKIHGRLEGSFHTPLIDNIMAHLQKHSGFVTTLNDGRISKGIVLPGRFKRVYIDEGQGVTFFGGKQLLELDPTGEKYLSTSKHSERIEGDLRLNQNMILVTRSGTIGKVNIVPKHWVNWIANEHIIRIVPISEAIAGYIFAWLDSDLGYELIHRFTYGSVVDEIDARQIAQVQIPLLKNKRQQDKINDLVLEANEKRYKAYLKEQEAISLINDAVIFKTGSKQMKEQTKEKPKSNKPLPLSPKDNDPPVSLDMPFDEAMQRIVRVKPPKKKQKI